MHWIFCTETLTCFFWIIIISRFSLYKLDLQNASIVYRLSSTWHWFDTPGSHNEYDNYINYINTVCSLFSSENKLIVCFKDNIVIREYGQYWTLSRRCLYKYIIMHHQHGIRHQQYPVLFVLIITRHIITLTLLFCIFFLLWDSCFAIQVSYIDTSVPARPIYEGAAPCPYWLVLCPIYTRPARIKKIFNLKKKLFPFYFYKMQLLFLCFSDSRCKNACKMLADLCPCFHRSPTRPNLGRSRVKDFVSFAH